jgi:nitroimidazol reductase NimA-like FMN-containing flavoprotein (pyridoxamine 5'-phosphate oxidase superfamily)
LDIPLSLSASYCFSFFTLADFDGMGVSSHRPSPGLPPDRPPNQGPRTLVAGRREADDRDMIDTTEPTPVVDRLGLEVLTPDECWQLVARAPVGRLAFAEDGGPMILPVVHGVVGRRIAFRSAGGGKLGVARMAGPVAFEVDGWDVDHHTGWSVVARGVARSAPDDTAELDALGLQPWIGPADRGTWVEVVVDEITGRRIAGPEVAR